MSVPIRLGDPLHNPHHLWLQAVGSRGIIWFGEGHQEWEEGDADPLGQVPSGGLSFELVSSLLGVFWDCLGDAIESGHGRAPNK